MHSEVRGANREKTDKEINPQSRGTRCYEHRVPRNPAFLSGGSMAKRILTDSKPIQEYVVSLCPVDIGYDLRTTKTAVHLPAEITGVVVPGRTITGSRETIVHELQSLGYSIAEGGRA